MALSVTLKNSSAKKGKYEYDGGGLKDFPLEALSIEKDKLLILLLEANGKKNNSSLTICTEKMHLFAIKLEQLPAFEWQLILTKDPSLISASQRKHKETGHNHGCGEEPGNGPGVTVTIGEP